MRSNREIRLIGRENLRGNYLASIANIFLMGLAGFALQWVILSVTGNTYNDFGGGNGDDVVALFFMILVGLASTLLSLGFTWGFLDMHDGERMTVGHLFLPFQNQPLKVVGFVFLKGILIYLWTLLLIIPGVVKSYSWAMAEYIYYDYPDIPNRHILAKSEEIMRGNRWQLFRLDFFYIVAYIVPILVWGFAVYMGFINSVLEGYLANEAGLAYLFWAFLSGAILMVGISILSFIIEPRRYAARAVFYTELVGIDEEEDEELTDF